MGRFEGVWSESQVFSWFEMGDEEERIKGRGAGSVHSPGCSSLSLLARESFLVPLARVPNNTGQH